VFFLIKNNKTLEEIPVGLPIKVDFIKDGGERFTLQCEITTYGDGVTTIVSFKLYKEQPIEAVMTVQGGYKDYDPIRTVQSQILTWERVRRYTVFGEVFDWEPQFTVYLQNNTIL
jgi:hypothetical protein